MKANLCRCNGCESILIDQDPQIGAKEYELTGKEIEMQFMQGLIENETDKFFYWACPICETDEFLTDL